MDPLQRFDQGYSAPPPAYTEQEFDQKVSTALEVSQQAFYEDEWEPYDPQAFEAAAAAYQSKTQVAGGSSAMPPGSGSNHMAAQSSSHTQPLRIHKKNAHSTDSKADMKKQDYAASKSSDQSAYHAGSSSNFLSGGSSGPYVYNEGDGDDIAPPPFSELPPQAHQDPHTEFDPYQGYAAPSAQQAPPPPTLYVGPPESPAPSADPQLSPLTDLQQSSFGGPPPQALAEAPRPQEYRQSLPAPPQMSHAQTLFDQSRPRSAMASPVAAPTFTPVYPNPPAARQPVPAGGSTLRFSPSVAYNRKPTRQPYVIPQEEPRPQAFSAASFYNAAVSSHMSMTPRPSAPSSYGQSPAQQQHSMLQPSVGSWGPNARPDSVYSTASYHTQSDSASQYGGHSATPSQAMAYNWRNGYQ